MIDEPQKIEIRCFVTGKTALVEPNKDGKPSLPFRWKRIGDEVYSPAGLEQTFVPRAIHFPISEVVCDEPKEGWKQLRTALRASWMQATQVCNWAMAEIMAADRDALIPITTKDGKPGWKLPKFSSNKMPLYQMARERWPELDSQSLGELLQKVRSRYMEHRWELRVRCTVSGCNFRYPTPLPIPAKDAKISLNSQKQPFINLRISGQRFTLRLRSGPLMHRQISTLRRVLAGEGRYGSVSLFEKSVGDADPANGGEKRADPGANRRATRIMCSISVYVRREEKAPGEKIMIIKTCPDRLWEIQIDGRDQPWLLNEDHLKSLIVGTRSRIARHAERLKRLAEDSKFERRHPKQERADINSYREDMCRRRDRRLNDVLHKATRMAANLAKRNGVAEVRYDDREHGFCSLPWFKLRTLLTQKLTEFGAKFVWVNGSDEKNSNIDA